ncbi:glycosyltransferase family 2 protein [Flavobacterium sp. KACC 22761]|uniref:glycosyltransferase family 2 protein n=1 Tax=Flavobacterium sp. KACC 22761 TaxID=3092665 RepID=UPI002A7572DF|nr:glycosyltransferase family 2 protein [Flavobacterium sp. KACC 22761]WPO79090.1 glycosyltransferase family 2 protein [Flavobacterium sp. KACC 22761]
MFYIPTIAVLLTCHNRKDKTINCLQNVYAQKGINIDFKFDIFLVDDGSIDGTKLAITTNFPAVNIIEGNGNLYWNQGMRLAWKTAFETKEFDFYFWLNDDTILDENALLNLIKTYKVAVEVEKKDVILTSACRIAADKNIFSYGGRTDDGPVIPNGNLQRCKYINGNAVLVPKKVYEELGNLSNDYTHGMGDFDYGLRALKSGFGCYTTNDFIATCPPNEGIPGWCNPTFSIRKRWELFHSPRGLNIKEYIKFRNKFWGIRWIVFAIKAYAKMISPKLYKKIS